MTQQTVTEIAAAVRAGALPPRVATQAVLDRIAERDEQLGAFQVVRGERALAEADEVAARSDLADLPLAGVPIAVKDNVAVAGEPHRLGTRASSDRPAEKDHEVVHRLRAAGAVVVGLTRLPELGVFGTTDSVYGVTRNPWDRTRTPGGSSGGSAAAVASGMVPAAHGNDGMGSIRIPAACCGLVGVKPGLGLVPAGVGPVDWYEMTENGPLATTVADAALLLSVLADRPELADVQPPLAPLRIGLALTPPVAIARLDPEHRRGAEEVARALRAAGHDVRPVKLPAPPWMAGAALARWFAGALSEVELVDATLIERRTRVHAAIGRRVRRFVDPEQRTKARALVQRAVFDQVDVLLTPTLAQPPKAAERWGEKGWFANVVSDARYAPYPAPWNFLGYPAASVPAGIHRRTGTPLAVQLAAPLGSEALLLSLAAQVEAALPWPRLAPGYA
jgi:amidase